MNWVLALVAAIFIIGCAQGYRKGIIRIAVSLISMFVSIFNNFAIDSLWNGALLKLGLSLPEIIVILLSCIIVGIGEHFKEAKLNIPVKWVIYVGLIMLIVIFGAYGPGYQEVDLIYAGF